MRKEPDVLDITTCPKAQYYFDLDERAKNTCMCGDDMWHHGNPMHTGHMPVSEYEYYGVGYIIFHEEA